MNCVKIYALIEPITLKIKYIGKTKQLLKKRLTAHLCESRHSNTKKNTWLKSLKKRGLKPMIEEIDLVLESEWEFWEMHYISLFRSWGFDLKNTDDGGITSLFEYKRKNPKPNKETREKISKSLLGNQFAKGYKHSNETRKKVGTGLRSFYKENPRSKEHNEKIAQKNRETKKNEVYQYDINNNFIKKFDSVKEAATETKSDYSTIYDCLIGKHKKCNGFIWKRV